MKDRVKTNLRNLKEKNILKETLYKERLEKTIKHEEDLINRRLGWMLTFQGFLFFAISKPFETSFTFSPVFKEDFLPLFYGIGTLNSLLTFLSIVAAYQTITTERKKINSRENKISIQRVMGRSNSLGMPLILFLAWLYLYFHI